nr:hypothetical protein [Cressdnaviricota sp.]
MNFQLILFPFLFIFLFIIHITYLLPSIFVISVIVNKHLIIIIYFWVIGYNVLWC